MGSRRLPGKSLKKYKGITPLEVLINRVKAIKQIKKIIISTTKLDQDNIFLNYAKKLKVDIFYGSSNNVLKRYFDTAKKFKSKKIIRLTPDCPFIDPKTLKKMIKIYDKNKFDYLSNTYPFPCTFPDGSDIEILNYHTLKKTYESAILPSDKEHVTKYIFNSKKFICKRIDCKRDLSKYRYTIDILEDYKLYKFILKNNFRNYKNLTMNQIIKIIDKNPHMIKYQKKLRRNFGWDSALEKDIRYIKKLKQKFQ